jgi:hypothetical protein
MIRVEIVVQLQCDHHLVLMSKMQESCNCNVTTYARLIACGNGEQEMQYEFSLFVHSFLITVLSLRKEFKK